MVYEFLFGGVPFGDDEDDPHTVYQKVLERKLIFPSNLDAANPVKAIIQQLLCKIPAVRIGGSIDKLKDHKWFQGFTWVNFI